MSLDEELSNPIVVIEKLSKINQYLPNEIPAFYDFVDYLKSRFIESGYTSIHPDLFISESLFAIMDLKRGFNYENEKKIENKLVTAPSNTLVQLRTKIIPLGDAIYGKEEMQRELKRYEPYGGIPSLYPHSISEF